VYCGNLLNHRSTFEHLKNDLIQIKEQKSEKKQPIEKSQLLASVAVFLVVCDPSMNKL
jgi:hypothetical protein